MKTTRRDLFKFAGGSAAGLMLTPVPWRLVTDAALWSENWPGIPRPARGEIRTRFTHCALCPAGCAVRARCVGDQPVALAGLPGNPLCAFGLTGHHMPYHANRVTQSETHAADEAVRIALAQRAAGESIAVLDLRPGRTASWTYRRAMAAVRGGIYLAPQSTIPGVNLDAVKTILSLGVPVLDGWGTPAKVLAARPHFRLFQAEPVESHTAALADEWLPIRKGSEAHLAAAIESAITAGVVPAAAAERTGLSESTIRSVAGELARGDALVLALEETPEVVRLNGALGAAGRTIVGRAEAPIPREWTSAAPLTRLERVPDHSIRVLLIDESAADGYFPWPALESKLVSDPLVVTFASSLAGYGKYSKFILPTAVYPEAAADLPPVIDSPGATFRIAAPLVATPRGIVDPARFIARLAGISAAEALRERAEAIHAAGRGVLHLYADARSVPVAELKAEDFWKALNEGGCWTGDAAGGSPPDLRPSAPAVVAMTWEMRAARGPMSPLASKLYEESNLRVRI